MINPTLFGSFNTFIVVETVVPILVTSFFDFTPYKFIPPFPLTPFV
jgi:hypothetical protein